MALPAVIDEDRVALGACLTLQGQRDQVAEATLRQRVLVREEPVIRAEAERWVGIHRLGQQVRTEPPGQRGRQGLLEEHPDMGALT
jgi:hypothetical protein